MLDKRHLVITSEKAYIYLLMILWCYIPIGPFVENIMRRLPIISYFSSLICPIIAIIFAFLSMKYILRRMKIMDIFLVMIFVLVLVWDALLFIEKTSFVMPLLPKLIVSFLMYYIGIAIQVEKVLPYIFKASLVNIGIRGLYVFNSGMTETIARSGDMNLSYLLLPSTLILGVCAFNEKDKVKKIIYYALFLCAFIFLFGLGTRGVILCVILFVFGNIFINYKNRKVRFWATLVTILVFYVYTCRSNEIAEFFGKIGQIFSDFGMSNRISTLFTNNMLSYDSGRSNIQGKVLTIIKEHPFLGYGLAADRYMLGIYAHNFIYEAFITFGVLVGAVFVAIPIVLIIRSLLTGSKLEKSVLMMLVACGFIKLFMSGSFLNEPYFYLMLGYCVKLLRRQYRCYSSRNLNDEVQKRR